MAETGGAVKVGFAEGAQHGSRRVDSSTCALFRGGHRQFVMIAYSRVTRLWPRAIARELASAKPGVRTTHGLRPTGVTCDD